MTIEPVYLRPLTLTNKMNNRLANLRRRYAATDQRPLLIDNCEYNFILLTEELNVFWDGLIAELEDPKNQNVDVILTHLPQVGQSTIDLHLYINPDLVVRIRSYGIEVNFKRLECISKLEVDVGELLRRCDNIRLNALQSDSILEIPMGENRLLREFFKMTNTPFKLIERQRGLGITIEFNDYLEVDDDHKSKVLKGCYHNHLRIGLEAILSTGYVHPVELLAPDNEYIITKDTRSVMAILESYYLTDQYKVDYLIRILRRSHLYDQQLYYHPTSIRYMKMIPLEEIDTLTDGARQFIINGAIPEARYNRGPMPMDVLYIHNYDVDKIKQLNGRWEAGPGIVRRLQPNSYILTMFDQLIPDVLDQATRDEMFNRMINNPELVCGMVKSSDCADPRLSDYWSRIPTDDELFLQFLDWRGVELPPSINNPPSIIRLSKKCSTDDVLRLIDLIEGVDVSDNNLVILLQLINRRIINIRHYLEHDRQLVYQLMKYLPIYGKSANRQL